MPFLDQNRTPRNILLHTIREIWHFISVRVVTREEACDGKLEGREMVGPSCERYVRCMNQWPFQPKLNIEEGSEIYLPAPFKDEKPSPASDAKEEEEERKQSHSFDRDTRDKAPLVNLSGTWPGSAVGVDATWRHVGTN